MVLAASLAPAMHAATKTWNTTSGSLSASTSWSPSGTPTTADEALFGGAVTPAASISTAVGTNLLFGNLIWDNNTSSTLRISSTGTTGTRLGLTGGGGFTAAIAAGGASGDLIVLGTNATSNTLTISEENPQGGASLRLRLENSGNFNVVNSGATLSIQTILSENGSRTLTKTGAGTLHLGSANTYTGGTVLNAGRLVVGNSSALGGGGLTLNGGTLASDSITARTLTNNISVGGNFTLGQGAGGNAITLNGAVDLGGAVRMVTLNNSATLGGAIGNGGLTLESSSSARSLTLGVANTFAGGLTVNGGTLVANHTGALGGGAVTVSGGTLDLLGAAAGTFVLGSGASFNLSSGVVRFTLGTSSDQIVGNAASFNLTGGTLELTLGEGFDYGATYHLLTSFTGGVVAGVAITGFDTGAYTATLSNVGVLSFAAVPEPASFASLAALGALGFAASRRRRG